MLEKGERDVIEPLLRSNYRSDSTFKHITVNSFVREVGEVAVSRKQAGVY